MYTLKKSSYYYDLCQKTPATAMRRRLFSACWRQYCAYLRSAIDNPHSDSDVLDWLDSIASEKVNNPKSKFYIYG